MEKTIICVKVVHIVYSAVIIFNNDWQKSVIKNFYFWRTSLKRCALSLKSAWEYAGKKSILILVAEDLVF